MSAAWNEPEVQALSFDCYGTLIDWEEGMRRVLEEEGLLDLLPEPFEEFVQRRARCEAPLETGNYRHYREVLALSLQEACRELEVKVDDPMALRFADSIPDWQPFPEAVSALRRLGSHWPLIILSNVDRAPMQKTVDRLGIPFAELVTAEDVRSYKPATAHFEECRRRLGERARGLLHVAGSVFHDIQPASALGISTVWVNRKGEKLPADVSPGLEVKDLLDVCKKLGV